MYFLSTHGTRPSNPFRLLGPKPLTDAFLVEGVLASKHFLVGIVHGDVTNCTFDRRLGFRDATLLLGMRITKRSPFTYKRFATLNCTRVTYARWGVFDMDETRVCSILL